ncbi:hypothetical protein PENTCL1PPCAC_9213, partial [Pristionchus entomophagus]
ETDTVEVGKTRKSARLSANHAKFIENMEDSDMRPSVKKSKTMNDSHVIPDFMFQRPIIRTTQCLFCETYPASTCGYAQHLQRRHKTTLKASGIFLLCSCGFEVRSSKYNPKHSKICNGHQFTVKCLDETTKVDVAKATVVVTKAAKLAVRQRPPRRATQSTRQILEEVNADEDEEEEEEENEEEMEDEVENVEEDESNGDDEVEPKRDYKKGGYHPVRIGDVFDGKYRVTDKLGWGFSSTVWLCKEVREKRSVALKILKSDEINTETAVDEIEMLKFIRKRDSSDPHRNRLVKLLDSFSVSGVNGTHACMAFEPLDMNLLQLIQQFNGLDIESVKRVIRQVLEGLDYLHTKCKIIHTDIKPENILVTVVGDNITQAKIADLGNACWTHQHFSDEIQTKEYKAPEVLIGVDYGTSVDIWSIACVTYEMITESYLFAPKEGEEGRVGRLWSRGPNYTCEADHVALITKAVGLIPSGVYKSGTHWNNFFNENGELLHVGKSTFSLAEQRRKFGKKRFIAQIMDFLDAALVLDPRSRATAAQCLQFEMFRQQQQPAAAAVEEEESGQEEMMDEEDQRPGPSGTN